MWSPISWGWAQGKWGICATIVPPCHARIFVDIILHSKNNASCFSMNRQVDPAVISWLSNPFMQAPGASKFKATLLHILPSRNCKRGGVKTWGRGGKGLFISTCFPQNNSHAVYGKSCRTDLVHWISIGRGLAWGSPPKVREIGLPLVHSQWKRREVWSVEIIQANFPSCYPRYTIKAPVVM